MACPVCILKSSVPRHSGRTFATISMKPRSRIIVTVVAAVVLLGCAAYRFSRNDSKFEVRYGGVLADRSEVREIRRIVSHQRWAALYSSLRQGDARRLRRCLGQLAFGRLRLVDGNCSRYGAPAAGAFYDDAGGMGGIEYELFYHNGRWVFAGCTGYDVPLRVPDLGVPNGKGPRIELP